LYLQKTFSISDWATTICIQYRANRSVDCTDSDIWTLRRTTYRTSLRMHFWVSAIQSRFWICRKTSEYRPKSRNPICAGRLIENNLNLSFLSLCVFSYSIKTLPMMAFENLNSLEILNLQNNKLTRVPEETLEAIVDTATVIDIMGE